MCGIAGVYGLEKISDPRSIVQEMNLSLSHRGPDADGIYEGKNVVLGHRRLSIIDLSPESNQPFQSNDQRYTLIFNGEVYNFRELREQLVDYDFRTQSDTEVVLAALITWGIRAVEKFNGMFALAFWDNVEDRLWLARDRMGIKPLYIAQGRQSIIFASEVRSILKSGLVAPKLDENRLSEYLRYQTVHSPNTILEGVKMLEPGCYLEISEPESRPTPYWKPWQSDDRPTDIQSAQSRVRELLISSVERRMVSDVPFGAFLSGGIDSSLIVGIIRAELDLPIDTFNVSFDENEFSEAKYARLVANKFGSNHHEIRLQPSDLLNSLDDALASMDHPSGDGPNTWIVAQRTKQQGITMAISGLGGDEVFAGYDVFKRLPSIAEKSWLLSFPKEIRSLIGSFNVLRKGDMRSKKMKAILTSDYFNLENLLPVFRRVLMDDQISGLLRNRVSKPDELSGMIKSLEEYSGFGDLPTLSRIGIAEMYGYMQNVLLRDSDQMAMSHALEVRVPFLDHELVEYVSQVPDPLKYPHIPKKLLIDSFGQLLPDEVVHRKKMGFVLPWEHWLKNELKDFCEERLEWLASTDYFDEMHVISLWEEFLKGSGKISWSRIWPLVTLADWMKRNNVE
ncbi:MAG: asparagine synthase (glutamine-hydrolyzing) [Flavobacteriales bacterium]|jgi:asparagine synthase (glutamine-hydrolysing)|nr:asparagine synthase (glutamine-hydrolyzing) [Flavobacteriales bacterium]MBT6131620.1 asparagine synthase (glutamine-hydrolyzing) [Flavobacteriales bacterium]MBT6917887.1 asparagine synthase (glutamine-hydrolyzing) [Flavobacteriales bacterium]MBT6978830.1 asparagine synthase (glutamine-hydrolyzing) [Flavobacteriales bacterium]MBT7688835.1 asparagine synthase (glutamine-hydrolyzing) [Flavobacteriales bacterium]